VELLRVEMSTQRTGDVVKARLPQHGIVEQSLDKNHLGIVPDLLHMRIATLRARKEAMSEGSANAAAVEVDDLFAFSQRKATR